MKTSDALNQPLMDSNASQPSDPMVGKVIAFGFNSTLVAVHMIGNCLILSSLGPDEEAAASLTSSIIGAINGTIAGILLTTGNQLGDALEEKEINDTKIASIIKIAWQLSFYLGLLSTSLFLLMRLLLPYILTFNTGVIAGNFLMAFAIAAIPELFIVTNGLIIGQIEKNAIIPLVSVALYRLPALALSYTFSKIYSLGAIGVGLGAAIGAVFSAIVMQLYLLREIYKKYNLYNHIIPDRNLLLKSFLKEGLKLALLRFSEWGNLAAIVLLIGHWDNSTLKIMQPAIQATTLINLNSQGMSLAAMMYTTRHRKKQTEQYKLFQETSSEHHLENFSKLSKENKSIFYKNNFAGLLLTTIFFTSIYFKRTSFMHLFLDSAIKQEQYDKANQFLLASLISTYPDMLRIVSGGTLRGWGDILLPTLFSIACMTIVGVPTGAAVAYAASNAIWFLWLRAATMGVSTLANWGLLARRTNEDNQLYSQETVKLNAPKFGSLFHHSNPLDSSVAASQNLRDADVSKETVRETLPIAIL